MIELPSGVKPTFAERQMIQRLLAANREVNAIFRRYIARVSPLLERYRFDPRGVLIRDRATEALMKKELDRFVSEFEGYVKQQQISSWQAAEDRTGGIIERWAQAAGLVDVAATGAYARNLDAMSKFLDRKVAGMGLSDRVWSLAGGLQQQLEFYLQSGLSSGRSADQIGRDVRQVLNEPDRRFRRVRDPLTGVLKPSKPMEDYHPGRGVYRSSYQNARRLARTEINMAYHAANMEMYRSSPVILGYEVRLSAAHSALMPNGDICDALAGRYPKAFTFHGWHPACMCFDVPVFMTDEQMEAWENGQKIQQVGDVPDSFKSYMAQHREQFDRWKQQPYFVNQNQNIIDRVYAGKPALRAKPFTHPEP
jgi:hypothetical protein